MEMKFRLHGWFVLVTPQDAHEGKSMKDRITAYGGAQRLIR